MTEEQRAAEQLHKASQLSGVRPRWVGQRHRFGCGVASVAMVTGVTYEEIASQMPLDFEDRGVGAYVWEQFLAERGYALAKIWRYYDNVERDPWPPPPFSHVHLCEVVVAPSSCGSHLVVMLADGGVLDPLTPLPRSLKDYLSVYFVAAVIPFARLTGARRYIREAETTLGGATTL